jgi:hypothetical protein
MRSEPSQSVVADRLEVDDDEYIHSASDCPGRHAPVSMHAGTSFFGLLTSVLIG